jgi:hypothetical protein
VDNKITVRQLLGEELVFAFLDTAEIVYLFAVGFATVSKMKKLFGNTFDKEAKKVTRVTLVFCFF